MTDRSCDILLTNLHLPDGGPGGRCIAIRDGCILEIVQPDSPLPAAGTVLDLQGDLLLPGLVDGHMHLDKTLLGLPWIPHQAEPSRLSRIETDQRLLPSLPLDTAGRAGHLLRRCVANGTAHVRTHADITPAFGLSALEGVLRARDAHAHSVTVQIVAFPQAGVMRLGGTPVLELLDAAILAGADLVGGIDPCEVDRDPKGQLDGIFNLAERRGVGLDIHLHEPGEMGLFSLQEICARTRALGLQGRVTISHGFCLGGIAESKQKAAAETMAAAGVSLVTHGAGSATMPPLMLLRRAGVRVFCGNDDVRDTWSPYGNADMLERASIIGWREDLRHDDLLHELFAMISSEGAAALGIEGHGIAVGHPATFFTLPVESVPEAIGSHPPRRCVFHKGRQVAGTGERLRP
ncbi:amidohydrolase family protein [Roseomonas sp. SSH11]|uniref:Amidohydrolase family protein n=1 Tax=Pararoseomonas baculiformis TaxID=2820812 RepID=A0ABS4AD93_9PROT|nr:amidohydrolase [Pararoseomonas baculiformis]MBP0444821.1 amidohydrolase family protein [Pararoseomonas baculiformis]